MGKYEVLRPLDTTEYQELKDSIRRRGVLIPIELDEFGNILDGHHRLRACNELRAEGFKMPDYPRVVRPGLTEEGKLSLIRDLNHARRHLGDAEVRNHREKRQIVTRSLKDNPDRADSWHAQQLGVDDHTVRAVREELEAGSEIPNLKTIVGADGKRYPKKQIRRRPSILVSGGRHEREALDLLNQIKAPLPVGQLEMRRLRGLARKAQAEERALRGDVTLPVSIDIQHTDFRELDLPAGSVDLIICDPPYARQFLPLWAALGRFAACVLKEGKLLVVYSPISLPEVLNELVKHLTYVAVGAVVAAPSGRDARLWDIHVYQHSKPLLFFSNGDYVPGPWFSNTVVSEAPEKDFHPWQQSIGPARYYIERLTRPGDLVCDPFLGSGTTAVAAHELGRHFIGCDVDLEAVTVARGRVAEGSRGLNVAAPRGEGVVRG